MQQEEPELKTFLDTFHNLFTQRKLLSAISAAEIATKYVTTLSYYLNNLPSVLLSSYLSIHVYHCKILLPLDTSHAMLGVYQPFAISRCSVGHLL